MFKQANPDDNKDHEREEERRSAQRKRDQAEIDRQAGKAAAAAGVEGDRQVIEDESKVGRGPAGINQGPSDTFSADPHKPRDDSALYGNDGKSQRSQGTGQSPPRGAQPTSDKPEPIIPANERAAQGNPEAQRQAQEGQRERNQANDQKEQGQAGVESAERKIADGQSAGPGDGSKPREDRGDGDKRK